MTQIRTGLDGPIGLSRQLVRGGLWLVLMGMPLLYYSIPWLAIVVGASGLFDQYQDIYIAGQPLNQPRPAIQWEMLVKLPAALLLAVLKAGPPVLVSGVFSALLLGFGWWLLRRRWLHWALRQPATVLALAGRLLGLLVLAYFLGCLGHLVLPWSLFNPPPLPNVSEFRAEMLHEEYLWPYSVPSAAAARGWTIYSPASLEALEFQPLKASSIKLGALLTTLLLYRRRTRRTPQAPLKSAKSVPSA